MSLKEHINFDDWQNRLQEFTSDNRGRKGAIKVQGRTLVENQEFVSVNYDSLDKGNDLIISVKGFTHTVQAPTELTIVKYDNGVVSTLEVIDQNNEKAFLRFI